MEIHHFSHEEHPLLLKDDKTVINDQTIRRCGICHFSNIAAPFYACDLCGYYLHKSCAELPQLLNHSFHPSHPLTLSNRMDYYNICESCHKVGSNDLGFYCDKCDFFMDVECAMMPPITFTEVDQKNIIQNFSHQHPMPLVEIDEKDNIICFGCQSPICSSDRAYGCPKCQYFLHESCAKLPQEIQYSLHPDKNLLTLRVFYYEFRCSVCNATYFNAFGFMCPKCDCALCVKCSARRGTFKYKYHEHLLCFLEKQKIADAFGHYCSNHDCYCKLPVVTHSEEFSCTSSFVLFCSECDFKVHLLCGPLPSVIKHECHLDPLILVDSLVEDNSGEYYCDVCEMKRDPRIRVYYCKQCKYVAHVHCVADEVIKILTGDLRDVELKNLGEDIWKLADTEAALVEEEQDKSRLITLKDLINALNKEEHEDLKMFYKWGDGSSKLKGQQEEYSAQSKLGDEDINEILQLSRFTNENLKKFFGKLWRWYFSVRPLELNSSDLDLEIVSVGGYKIPHTLAPVLKALLHKYGDVTYKCKSTKEWKSIAYFILCKALKSMRSTKVADITRNLLQEWYYHLTFVCYRGVEIDFARAHLERIVVPAFLGHEAKRLEDEIPTMLNQRIAKMKKGLEKCEEYRGSSPKSEFMEDCLNKAYELKWKDACEALFTDYDQTSPHYEPEYWYGG